MLTLWAGDGRSVGEIAETLGLESSTLTPLLQRLEQAGFIDRRRDPESERRVLVTLTSKGVALRGKAHAVTDSLADAATLNGRELAEINRQVRRLKDALAKD
jgi:DNA-binding MarR family transcriptional regulator